MQSECKLPAKRQRFVDEYLADPNLNATEAYKRAGFKAKNDNVAGVEASKLLKNPKIAAAIQAAMLKRQQRTEITQDRVLQELARIAFFDPRKLLHPDGSPKMINELDDDTAAAIAGMDITEEWEGTGDGRKFIGYTKKYKITDKNTALTNAMRHLGMLNDKLEISGKVDVVNRILEARKRARSA